MTLKSILKLSLTLQVVWCAGYAAAMEALFKAAKDQGIKSEELNEELYKARMPLGGEITLISIAEVDKALDKYSADLFDKDVVSKLNLKKDLFCAEKLKELKVVYQSICSYSDEISAQPVLVEKIIVTTVKFALACCVLDLIDQSHDKDTGKSIEECTVKDLYTACKRSKNRGMAISAAGSFMGDIFDVVTSKWRNGGRDLLDGSLNFTACIQTLFTLYQSTIELPDGSVDSVGLLNYLNKIDELADHKYNKDNPAILEAYKPSADRVTSAGNNPVPNGNPATPNRTLQEFCGPGWGCLDCWLCTPIRWVLGFFRWAFWSITGC